LVKLENSITKEQFPEIKFDLIYNLAESSITIPGKNKYKVMNEKSINENTTTSPRIFNLNEFGAVFLKIQ
jgi:hypothetical protein